MFQDSIAQYRGMPLKGRADEDLLDADMIALAREFGRYGYRKQAVKSGTGLFSAFGDQTT